MLIILVVLVFSIAAHCQCDDGKPVIDPDLSRGKELVDAYKGKEAIPYLSKAIAKDPKNAEVYYYRGLAYAMTDEQKLAIDDFTKAISINKTYVNAYIGRSREYFVSQDRNNAMIDINKAIDIDHKNANAYCFRGAINCSNKEYKKAVADFATARELDAKHVEAREFLADLYATCVDVAIRDGKKALEAATEACKLTKYNDFMALQCLAASYAELGKFEEAVKWQKKALALLMTQGEVPEDWANRLKLFEKRMPLRYEDPILGR